MPFIEGGVRGAVTFAKTLKLDQYGAETRKLMDEARKGRDGGRFKPKGDGLLDDSK